MNTRSQHLLMDLWLDKPVEPVVLELKQYIEKTFNIVQRTNFEFDPQGETIVFILSESHFSLHTYPEHNYITLDIYICNMGIDMVKVKNEILQLTLPVKQNSVLLERGTESGIKNL